MDTKTPKTQSVEKPFRPGIRVLRRGGRPRFDEALQAPDDGRDSHFERVFSVAAGSSILPTEPDNFATEILYHRLSVSMTTSGLPSCTYLDGSGISRFDPTHPLDQDDIFAYMDALQDGLPTLTAGLYNGASDAPNIMVRSKCYVVIELHTSMGLRFINDDPHKPALETGADWGGRYCNLWQYDVEWNKSNIAGGLTQDCYLFYFGVRDIVVGNNDLFNLNFQTGDAPDAIYISVDPAIKNRGPRHTAMKAKKPVLARH